MKKSIFTFLILFSLKISIAQTATISGTTEVCMNVAEPQITFTGNGGVEPYTFYFNINGGAVQNVVSSGNTATVNCPTGISGSFSYGLVSVTDANSSSQTQSGIATITVNPLPTAAISGSLTVCQGAPQTTITFTGANGTTPYTFYYNVNGGVTQSVVSAGNTATVSVPTNVADTFEYNLLSIQDASSTQCQQIQTGTVTVIVEPCLGIGSLEIGKLDVFPNPVKSELFLNTTLAIEEIQLMNMAGQIVLKWDWTNGQFPLNVSGIENGIYFLKVNTGDSSHTKQIAISH